MIQLVASHLQNVKSVISILNWNSFMCMSTCAYQWNIRQKWNNEKIEQLNYVSNVDGMAYVINFPLTICLTLCYGTVVYKKHENRIYDL